MKPYTQSLKTILLALILSFGISFVSAWTGPTATPPAGNTSAPINTGTGSQYKNGWFTANYIETYGDTHLASVGGNVGIGTTAPSAKLEIGGIPGTDGIKFPDGTVQTSAASISSLGYEVIFNYGTTAVYADCTTSKAVLGGGCSIDYPNIIHSSFPVKVSGSSYYNSWYCNSALGNGLGAYAICANY